MGSHGEEAHHLFFGCTEVGFGWSSPRDMLETIPVLWQCYGNVTLDVTYKKVSLKFMILSP